MEALTLRQRCNKRFEALKNEASTWVPTWKELRDYIAPSRGFFDEVPNDGKSYDHKLLVDSTQVTDNETLASGLLIGLTSPNRPWFNLVFSDDELMEDKEVRTWLEQATEKIREVFQESNIYGTLYNVYEEIGCFGFGAMAIEEDFEKVISNKNFTCGEYYISRDKNGMVNGFAREYWRTVSQIVEEFGLERCSVTIQQKYKDCNMDKWVQIRHIIEPNFKRVYGKSDNTNMPFISRYWEASSNEKEDQFLSVSGFEEFPIMAPRWSVPKESTNYGRGPGWKALGDIKMVQKMQKDKLMGLSKVVNPPVQVDSSVVGQVNMLAGGITRFNATLPNAGVKTAYQVPVDLKDVDESIMKTRDDIGKAFHRQTFLSITSRSDDKANMTATEINALNNEKLLSVGAVLNKLEKELLTPMIIRTFMIMFRRLMFPPPPPIIMNRKFDIEYTSILFQAQRMAQLGPNQALVGYAVNASAAFPNVLQIIDSEEAIRQYAIYSGASSKLVRSREEVQQIRQQQAEQQMQQQQMQNAGAAVQAAKVLSETSLENNSALRALITP